MKALVHYFSGTGNTAHAARVLSAELKSLDIEVTLQNVARFSAVPSQESGLHIFMFPVYALTIPYTMQLYMKKFSGGNRRKAVVIANHGMAGTKGGWHTGYESQSLAQAVRILKRRNFDVLITDKVGYPENLTVIANPLSEGDCKAIFEAGDSKIKEIARSIAGGKRHLKKYGAADLTLGWLLGGLFTYFGRWQFGKFYISDENCNGCRVCEKACPAKAVQVGGGKPVWGYECDACLRCFNLCPQKAIQVSLPRLVIFIVLTIGLIPAVAALFPASAGFFALRLILGIISYFVLFTVIFFILEKIIFLLEKISFVRAFFQLTHTRNIQRYTAPGFGPKAAKPAVKGQDV